MKKSECPWLYELSAHIGQQALVDLRDVVRQKPVKEDSDVVGVDLGLKSAAAIHDAVSSRALKPSQALRRNLVKLRRLDLVSGK